MASLPPANKLLEGNVFTGLCLSFCLRGSRASPCDHYPRCIGLHCTAPPPLLVTSGGHHWRPVQTNEGGFVSFLSSPLLNSLLIVVECKEQWLLMSENALNVILLQFESDFASLFQVDNSESRLQVVQAHDERPVRTTCHPRARLHLRHRSL